MVNNSSIFLQTIMFIMNQSNFQDTTSYNYYYLDIGKAPNATKCYGMYGCFELGEPWTTIHRPVSYFPNDLEQIEPKFLLYTRHRPTRPYLLDLNEDDIIGSAPMNPKKPLYVICHGFLEGGGQSWIKEMTKELLRMEDCSVIVVDWHGGSSPPYTQAVANIRLLGAITAHLVAEVASYTKGLNHVHCIGHSLGAHLCGYVGYTLQKEFNLVLERITGLDPAEPHFAKSQPPVRLDKTAARYVDIVHSDASRFLLGGFGIVEPIGHVDYYPNGGSDQPGCNMKAYQHLLYQDESIFKGVRKYIGCNHIKSYEFFIESINPKCSWYTMSCSSFEEFQDGKCFECGELKKNCLKFGYHGRRHYTQLVAKGVIKQNDNLTQYLMTGSDRPYCRAHYKIMVTISDSEKSKLHRGEVGQLIFTMHSTTDGKGYKSEPAALKGGYHEPGHTYTGVIATNEVDNLKAVEVEWKYNSSLFNPLTWRILASPRIYLKNVTVESLEIGRKITVCPKSDVPLISGFPQLLIPSYC
ncbi:pancreatic lipase-related protein 2 isoform X1 [Coccinella septempunctata]|uniref:pancreatic lipase-related protein 2 isoform X1 n=1 Tax=Coccinella septempunctata TaxID=41139 RepID=UPI001D0662BF|nr:pancreatic lipase-related protein 2 isoform X1 [Coccinella septempunctata]